MPTTRFYSTRGDRVAGHPLDGGVFEGRDRRLIRSHQAKGEDLCLFASVGASLKEHRRQPGGICEKRADLFHANTRRDISRDYHARSRRVGDIVVSMDVLPIAHNPSPYAH